MKKWILHITGTRKSAYLLICFLLLFPLIYSIVTNSNGAFNTIFFWTLLISTIASGIGLSLVIMTSDYYLTERLRNRLTTLELEKLGDGNFRFIDHYTGWSRKMKLEGTFANKKLSIDYRFEKGNLGQITYLTVATKPMNRIILEMKADKYLTVEHLEKRINDVLADNSVYKTY